MKVCDLQFDEDLETSVFISALKKKVRLVLSDDLEASEQQLSEEYKQRIVQFLEEISIWYNKTIDAVKQYADGKYGIKDVSDTDIELMAIFILFEQDEPDLFGLSYRTEFDVEHGCGIKLKGNGQQFEIVEIGCADVAFC
ncbi:hypothetical protein [Prevotella nigrescens]|uniref:hypothetical protein n=1 Tax=Prevotella nigrescens TaxID=28133 RepID=UPI0002184A85|nr:hypothetical protein [Prevotella nigrescens]EGQ13995.1 hypothetical protein HMPREF9419_1438 [Prevotella nigrescens ATCC 33563]UAK28492.1 hypothetical protein K8O81_00230 [Prevotella nigrescens]WMS22402.1 hypothetical protein RDV52_04350 [Prevotella nigrescens]SUB93173.1 Uncharacterised protein [Prevotella nigrescens]